MSKWKNLSRGGKLNYIADALSEYKKDELIQMIIDSAHDDFIKAYGESYDEMHDGFTRQDKNDGK